MTKKRNQPAAVLDVFARAKAAEQASSRKQTWFDRLKPDQKAYCEAVRDQLRGSPELATKKWLALEIIAELRLAASWKTVSGWLAEMPDDEG